MQKKIMKVEEWEDAVQWRVACDCSDPDHDMGLWIEFDPKWDTYGFSLEFSSLIKLSDWGEPKWHDRVLWRIRKAWAILRHGELEHNATFLLSGDNIVAFEVALKEAKKKFSELVKAKKK